MSDFAMSVREPEFAKVAMTAHVADDSQGRGLAILQVVKLESCWAPITAQCCPKTAEL